MKPSHLQTILLSLLLVSCAGTSAHAQAGGTEFTITPKNQDDQVSVQVESEIVVIDIQSPSGIGAANVDLKSGVMPGKLMLRLHLKGLELIRVSATDETVSASVSSSETSVIHQTLLSSGVESPILPGNPAWLEIETMTDQEGFFEIRLPMEFLQKAGTSFTVEWIDF